MPQQGGALGIVECAFVCLADRGAGGRDDHSFSHCYTFGWMRQSDYRLGRTSALLRVSHQMIGRIAKLDVDGVYSLEVMTDVQFITHTHASVQLHGLLCDEARGVADLRLRARRQLRSIWLPSREAEVQML